MNVALIIVIVLLVLSAVDFAVTKWGAAVLLCLWAIAVILLCGVHI